MAYQPLHALRVASQACHDSCSSLVIVTAASMDCQSLLSFVLHSLHAESFATPVFRLGCICLTLKITPYMQPQTLIQCSPNLMTRHSVSFSSSFCQPLDSPPAASSCSPALLTRLRDCHGFCALHCLSPLKAIAQAASI